MRLLGIVVTLLVLTGAYMIHVGIGLILTGVAVWWVFYD